MNADEMAPQVRSILDAARERSGGETRVSVDPRSLADAFAAAEADGRIPLIAEIKPTSPTTDGERRDDPVALARQMIETLERVRAAVDVPVLRKDFVLDEAALDVVEADVILLIARFLGDDLERLTDAANERGFQVLVETHTREEIERAVAADAAFVGVNNRDLAELSVDLTTFEEVASTAPESVTLIAESGIRTVDDVRRMRTAGADALLVGSAIMAGNVEQNTHRLTHVRD
ncbi:indole-3-glycerol phosphate synthase [Halobacteriales archaeon SW_8_65_20]|nr:MAG: indole-3-glycerol phosphate synthase [Halobacteriales archaeon SW_8_65_20]